MMPARDARRILLKIDTGLCPVYVMSPQGVSRHGKAELKTGQSVIEVAEFRGAKGALGRDNGIAYGVHAGFL